MMEYWIEKRKADYINVCSCKSTVAVWCLVIQIPNRWGYLAHVYEAEAILYSSEVICQVSTSKICSSLNTAICVPRKLLIFKHSRPAEFYKHFWKKLSQLTLFVKMADEIKNNTFIPYHMNTELISLLKTSKDPTHCSSYRPISLINTNIKIIRKALTARGESVISSLVHADQTGFTLFK